MNIYSRIAEKTKKNQKQLAVLIDPNIPSPEDIVSIAQSAEDAGADYIFIGGSLLLQDNFSFCIKLIKDNCALPIVIFPGNYLQIDSHADAILLLSLISGRNAEMLIGNHVIAAPFIKKANLETISTGYMVIDGGKSTSVSYISNSLPIPSDKDEIAICTAMAGEMLGLKLIYLEAGSGAINHVPLSMIRNVKESIDIPLIVGGAIKDRHSAENIVKAGADMIVVGNAIENNHKLIYSIAEIIK